MNYLSIVDGNRRKAYPTFGIASLDDNVSGWKTIGQVGRLESYKDEFLNTLDDSEKGRQKRFVWLLPGLHYVDFLNVCMLYEQAYLEFFSKNSHILDELTKTSGIFVDGGEIRYNGYLIQEDDETKIFTKAIMNAVFAKGKKFCPHGERIFLSGSKVDEKFRMLCPEKIPFHRPEYIVSMSQRIIEKGQIPGSVKVFFDSNRYLQVQKKRDAN